MNMKIKKEELQDLSIEICLNLYLSQRTLCKVKAKRILTKNLLQQILYNEKILKLYLRIHLYIKFQYIKQMYYSLGTVTFVNFKTVF